MNEELVNGFIMLVSATDADSTTNAFISYSVDLTEFTMDPSTGILTTTTIALNRETTSSYFITICARDGGSTILSVCQSVSYDLCLN